jgi:hypothetical protein
VSIARRRGVNYDVAVAVPPVAPQPPPPMPGGVPLPLRDAPAPDTSSPIGRLRRCTFRRIDRMTAEPQRRELPVYEVMCLFADSDDPEAIGDIEATRPICHTCTARGIFRPDED